MHQKQSTAGAVHFFCKKRSARARKRTVLLRNICGAARFKRL